MSCRVRAIPGPVANRMSSSIVNTGAGRNAVPGLASPVKLVELTLTIEPTPRCSVTPFSSWPPRFLLVRTDHR